MSWVPPAMNTEQIELYHNAGFNVLWVYPKEDDYQLVKKHWDRDIVLYTFWNGRLKTDQMLDFHPEDPKLIGYVISDEPTTDRLAGLKGSFDKFRDKRPDKICLVNLFPSSVPDSKLGSSYQDHLEEYFKLLKPRVCSLDNYPCYWFNIDRTDYYHDLELLRRLAIKNNSTQIGFVQSFSSEYCRNPSESDMNWQVNTLIAYGCKGLWYFCYRSPRAMRNQGMQDFNSVLDFSAFPVEMKEYSKPAVGFPDGIIGWDDKPTYLYPIVKKINEEVTALSPILMKLRNIAVRHYGNDNEYGPDLITIPVGTDAFSKKYDKYISEIKTVKGKNKGYIVSYFVNDQNVPYIMIVNKNHGENISRKGAAVSVEIAFKETVNKLWQISPTDCSEGFIELKDHKLQTELDGGGFCIFKIEPIPEKKPDVKK